MTGSIREADSPTWLVEGSAEYASYRYVVDRGMANYDSIRRSLGRYLPREQAAPLGSVVNYLEGPDYAVAFLAVDRLATDGGLRLLGDYFVDAGNMDWKVAFKKHFGMEVEAFIRDFEASRNPESNIN